jgi:hypothetical protein
MAPSPDGKILLFGGRGAAPVDFADTWTWDGSDWQERKLLVTPPPRMLASMAFHAPGSTPPQTVLFGGIQHSVTGATVLDDTWIWNGSSWIAQSPINKPPARYGASLSSGPGGTVVLFGGLDGTGSVLNDTWVWDGINWVKQALATEPPPRYGASMVGVNNASLGSAEVVLFGGCPNSPCTSPMNDTWIFDGHVWKAKSFSVPPSSRSDANIGSGFLVVRGHSGGYVLLFGGTNSSGTDSNDVWSWIPQ